MHDPKQNACSFFSVVVISVDAKKKALEILCIGLHTRGGNFSPRCWPLLSQKVDTSNYCQKTHPCWSEKTSTLWMTPFNVQNVNVFLADVCECFETSSKSSMLSTSNRSSDVHGVEQL